MQPECKKRKKKMIALAAGPCWGRDGCDQEHLDGEEEDVPETENIVDRNKKCQEREDLPSLSAARGEAANAAARATRVTLRPRQAEQLFCGGL